MTLRALLNGWFAPGPAERPAVLRVLLAGFGLYWIASRAPEFAHLAALDVASFAPVGIARILPAPLHPFALACALCACAIALVLLLVGYRYRVTSIAATVLLFALASYRSSFGMLFHSDNLLVLQLAALCCCRAADALSIDARGRPVPAPAERYAWPLRMMALLTVATYMLAGIAKLRSNGLAWADGDLLRHQVAFNAVRKAELGGHITRLTSWMLEQPLLFAVLALGTLLLELSGPLALTHRRVAQAWALAMFSFHWGVLIVMGIPFVYPLSGVAFAVFFPLERIARLVQGHKPFS